MSEHTKGPWRTDASYTDVFAGDDEFICSCEGSRNGLPLRDEEDLANARLIAAAPDLLAACKKMVKLYYPGKDEQQSPGDYIKEVDAAIAKAEMQP